MGHPRFRPTLRPTHPKSSGVDPLGVTVEAVSRPGTAVTHIDSMLRGAKLQMPDATVWW